MAPTDSKATNAYNLQALRPMETKKIAKKAQKMLKPIFRGKVMAFSGDFGAGWSHDQMSNWIRLHAGEYVRDISPKTTHLICSIEDYKKRTPQGMFYFPSLDDFECLTVSETTQIRGKANFPFSAGLWNLRQFTELSTTLPTLRQRHFSPSSLKFLPSIHPHVGCLRLTCP